MSINIFNKEGFFVYGGGVLDSGIYSREPLIESARGDSTQFWPANLASGKMTMVSGSSWGLEIQAEARALIQPAVP